MRCSRFNWATASPPWRLERPRLVVAGDPELQLGHGVAAVETRRVQLEQEARDELQLGHGVAAVETDVSAIGARRTTIRFNWATASPPWRPGCQWPCWQR